MLAQVPRRRAIAARLCAGELLDRRVGADQVRLLLGARLRRRRDVRPAVMADLVAGRDHLLADLRMALDREAGREPGAAQPVRLEQAENPPRAGEPELAARQRRRRRHPARDEAGLGVEIERQADDVAGHGRSSAGIARRGHDIRFRGAPRRLCLVLQTAWRQPFAVVSRRWLSCVLTLGSVVAACLFKLQVLWASAQRRGGQHVTDVTFYPDGPGPLNGIRRKR